MAYTAHDHMQTEESVGMCANGGAPVGAKEVGELLGVKRATVQQWQFREVLPPPDYRVNGLPAWRVRTILEWARRTHRLRNEAVGANAAAVDSAES